MRIQASENYRHEYECPLGECQRRYCHDHRLLYRDCDTAYRDGYGDRETRVRYFWSSDGECPDCKAEIHKARFLQTA